MALVSGARLGQRLSRLGEGRLRSDGAPSQATGSSPDGQRGAQRSYSLQTGSYPQARYRNDSLPAQGHDSLLASISGTDSLS